MQHAQLDFHVNFDSCYAAYQVCFMQSAAISLMSVTDKQSWNKVLYLSSDLGKCLQREFVIIFLPISLNICFGCSKEPSH